MQSPAQTTPSGATAQDYPLNAWYAAAYDIELKNELLARTLCDRDLVMYRRADGSPVVLADSCWHRMLPLSKGRLVGDEVVCGYHGLRFNGDGRCTQMPSQETINPTACVRSYPAVQKHRFVWVWMGDPALADPADIPDLHWNDDPEWAGDGEVIHANCNYKLVLDNLMDLTHETFVHGSSIGQDAVAEAPFMTFHGATRVEVERWMTDLETAPPFWRQQMMWKFGEADRVDRWQIIRFQAPSTIAIDVGVARAETGAPQGDRSQGVNGYVLNTITPERDGSCWYFWAFCRNYSLTDQAITQRIKAGVRNVFREDELILEAQQKAIDAHPGRDFYNLNIDAGGVWARKLIDRMIEAERERAAAA